MYAAIRQGKAKTGTAEELARRIKEVPFRSSVMSKVSWPITWSMRRTTRLTAISIFNNYAERKSRTDAGSHGNRTESRASAHRAGHRRRRAG